MPGVHRLSDMVSGHGCPPGGPCGAAPPTLPASYSSDTDSNNLFNVRQSDSIIPHICFSCNPCPTPCTCPCGAHGGVYTGSHTVTVNFRSIQIMGDMVTCNAIALGCSGDVIVE
jgi:hypothetical protein